MSTRFTYANAASKANGQNTNERQSQSGGSSKTSSSSSQQQSVPVQQEQRQQQVPPPTLPLNKKEAKTRTKVKTRLKASSVLRDKFVPNHLKAINYASVSYRWVLGTNRHIHQVGFGIIEGPGSPSDGIGGSSVNPSAGDMDVILAQMAENFIPRVPCMCRSGPQPMHGPYYYAPFPVHRVPPGMSCV